MPANSMVILLMMLKTPNALFCSFSAAVLWLGEDDIQKLLF